MWREVGSALGSQKRDSLWGHPDLLPTLDDIANPAGLIERIRANDNDDDIDKELRELLN
jgi:uncharacterized protein (DUF2342 family)